MTDAILLWPDAVLRPGQVLANPAPFSRSGGRSLSGLQRSIRTDRGFWKIAYKGVPLKSAESRRAWNVMRTALGGMAGLAAVMVLSNDSAPWLAGTTRGKFLTPHSDGSTFSDGSMYETPGIVVELATAAAIGDTSLTLRLVYGLANLSGVRFSWQHALYETGVPTLVDDDEWTVPVFPAVRAAIPADAALELDRPTCLVHLAADNGMDATLSPGGFDKCDVDFVEAVDYWNDLAAA